MNPVSSATGTTPSIRVMFVDDEALTRVGLRALLEAYAPRIAVIAEARSASEAFSLLGSHNADIVLTDLRMQGNSHSGLELVASIRQQYPDLPVLVVTGHNDDAMIVRVFKAGASGFVSKEGEAGEILRAIETVHGGATFFPRNLQRLLDAERSKPTLSRREQEVCDLIAIDMSSKEIARALGIDYRTVDTHRGNIVTKLGKSGLELHRHCMDELNARFPELVRRDSKAKLITILAHHGVSQKLMCSRLGLTEAEVAALLTK